MRASHPTFIGAPSWTDLDTCPPGFAVIGIPHGVLSEELPDARSTVEAPRAIRVKSYDALISMDGYDFDLGGTLLDGQAISIVDCGDLPGSPDDPDGNRECARDSVSRLIENGAIPLIIGGDDSVPICAVEACAGTDPLTVIQIDAHLDWQDEYNGVRYGHSSTMRRISELPWVQQIVQIGIHGVSGSTPSDYQDALDWGAQIITASVIHTHGVSYALERIPSGGNFFITLDCDGLDAMTLPASTLPMPGGLFYHQILDLIHGVLGKGRLIGFDIVEFAPARDLNGISALTLARIMLNVIGGAARQQSEHIDRRDA